MHKNVSYRPKQDILRGDACETAEDNQRLHDIMRRYSMQVTKFLSRFLAPYAPHWTLDFASYRPLEEKGRDLPIHKRNDLMHVDAFPSRPDPWRKNFTRVHQYQSRTAKGLGDDRTNSRCW